MHAPHVHVMGRGPMARGHHTSLDVLCLHAVEKAVSTVLLLGSFGRMEERKKEKETEGRMKE